MTREILIAHSMAVAKLALQIARHTLPGADLEFIREACLLHDIGILHTDAPDLGCHGPLPYLAHGYKGREMLEDLGLPRHALVCERHTGVGIRSDEVVQQQLPLPVRDYLPESDVEILICYADLFFSKNPNRRHQRNSPEQVRQSLTRFGDDKVATFNRWHARFAAALQE
ncbi:MAG: phosphohydrolase [Desulfuromonas sp.]|nr:MAG: phosphohydrolase [Desulfuromonas sp.]